MKKYNRLWLMMLVCGLAFTQHAAMAMTDQQKKMIDQLDQLDQLDHLDFLDHKEKAEACIRARDFYCAEKKIAKAAKSASSSRDKKSLKYLQQSLAAERNAVADEQRRREEEARQEEERQEEARREARRRQDAEDREDSARANREAWNGIINGMKDLNAQMAENDRQTNRLYVQAMQERQEKIRNQQREADEARARENERVRQQNERYYAQQRQQQAYQQDQARQQQTRRQEQERQQEQARQQQQARQQEQARKKTPETRTVVAEGDSGLCFYREGALKQAQTSTYNNARKSCEDLGEGWTMIVGDKAVNFGGYVGYTACTGGERGNFRVKITQAIYNCIRR